MEKNELLKTRIKSLNESSKSGKCVVYVMSRDQRVKDNHALLAAQKQALANNLPLAVVFCLYEKSGFRAREHYEFMLEGLKKVEKDLKVLNIPFILLIGQPRKRVEATFHHLEPDAVYFDFSPLRGSIKLQNNIANKSNSRVCTVDTHNVVPAWITTDKKEVGAFTIRPKIHRLFEQYLEEPEQIKKHPIPWPGSYKQIKELNSLITENISKIKSNGTKIGFESGEKAAADQLDSFIKDKLSSYAVDRNNPSSGGQSGLSPYLHFGQLSSLRVALELRQESLKNGNDLHLLTSSKMPKPEVIDNTKQYGIDSLMEEMIVRKELADNFCYYDDNYDNLESAPNWARNSLDKHREDARDYLYERSKLEQAETHDAAWNAAQKQLTATGKMHGYMRMYWAKKVLEWSPIRPHNNGTLADFSDNFDMDGIAHTATRTKFPEEIHNCTHSERSKLLDAYFSQFSGPEWAIEVLKYLNDHYSIDGGDPNGYAGILWSVAGVHDRPWGERDVFGVIRYMNYAGLKRKFNIEEYEKQFS